ncbi:hypothetical protein [Actinomadura macrotermitis]|uniref:Uncharacterized protein n=1 Tax=Actinomadura macrotermitis TaxID=2585200 RepID=A0A7K0C075_9ACTN|nr:hypothetical protein [Actinomadura macrotermitis]MQY06482.1 hypothetical protein [Actinomadura macrotermitis]
MTGVGIIPADQVEMIRQEIARRYPGAKSWYGTHTGNWWALVWGGRWRLVEAPTPAELAQAIEKARGWPRSSAG